MNEKEAAGKLFNNSWRVQMKNKLTLMFLMLIAMILMMEGSVFAVTIKSCTCGATTTKIKYSTWDPNETTYHGKRYVCASCGTYLSAIWKEAHNFGYTSAGESGHKQNRCACGYYNTSTTVLPHNYVAYTPISLEQCQSNCKSCGYITVEDHNFVNDVCTKCGLRRGQEVTIFELPEKNAGYYYGIENTGSEAMEVTIELFGRLTDDSKKGRKLTFTDSIPAGTTRYYTIILNWSITVKPLFFGYIDAGSTSGNTLAIVAGYGVDDTASSMTKRIDL